MLERGNVRELGDLVKLSPGLTIAYGSQPGNFSISSATSVPAST